MENSEFQIRVAEFIKTHKLETSVPSRVLDLVAEAGELAKEASKATEYGRTSFRPSESWREELGDVFFALVCLANSTNVNLEEALEQALTKYRRRIEETGEPSS